MTFQNCFVIVIQLDQLQLTQTSQIRHFKVSIYKTLTAEHFKSFWWHRGFALVKYSDFDLKRSSLVGN